MQAAVTICQNLVEDRSSDLSHEIQRILCVANFCNSQMKDWDFLFDAIGKLQEIEVHR